MKKVLLSIAVLLLTSFMALAQQGKIGVGGSLSYGSDIESIGFGARFQYNITDRLRIAPNMTRYIQNNNISAFELNGDIHYLFPMGNNATLYPVGGLAITQWNWDDGSKHHLVGLGLNLGGGIQYDLSENFSLIEEIKYLINDDLGQFIISTGLVYSF